MLLYGKLWTYLADLNEQARERMECMITQMKAAEGVTEELKARASMAWVGAMNRIRNRAEGIVLREMIYEGEEASGLGRIRKQIRNGRASTGQESEDARLINGLGFLRKYKKG